jgi:hypothetical protein
MGSSILIAQKRRFALLGMALLQLLVATAPPAQATTAACAHQFQQLDSTAQRSTSSGLQSAIGSLNRLPAQNEWGPHAELRLGTSGWRAPEKIETLTIGQYNVLDLHATKPEKDMKGVAETILRADPDVLILEEVGGAQVLSDFNARYLGSKYEPLLIEGNGNGIHVGFLLKKDLPFNVEAQSFKNVADSVANEPLFSRDLPVLVFRERGGDARGPPRFAVAGTHYKSQRTRDATIDTAAIRTRQAEASAEILQHYRQELGPKVPLILGGDFNDDIRHAASFDSLKTRMGFRDSFDLAPPASSVPTADRVTQTFHPRDGSPTVWSQLDAILISGVTPESGIVRESRIVPYLDSQGGIRPIPKTHAERHQNPSDHFMVRTVMDYAKLRQLQAK